MNGLTRQHLVEAFVNRWYHKPITHDGTLGLNPNGPQCVDLANVWYQSLGLPSVSGNAIDFIKNHDPGYLLWIANEPNNCPHRGDTVIWSNPPGGSPADGHIDLCVWSTTEEILGFDQNWNTHFYGEYIDHTFEGVAGWLRPKKLI